MEREIEIAGHWLIFMLILGMVLSMCGIAGSIIGYAYADPSQAVAHSILHPIARVAVILGPIALLSGAAMFLGSIYGIHNRQSPPTPTVAPISYKGFQPITHKAMEEEEAEEELPEIRSGWRKSC
jgi:hypothetical protein